MYDCCTGKRTGPESELPLSGCVLAHAPGLGKTLSTLSLIFTMLKSGPSGQPLVRKAVVVCPASLCNNWAKEVKRWLPQRLTATLLPQGPPGPAAEVVKDFARCPPQKLLILSYEAARSHCSVLERAGIGLLVCDEGHRLKNTGGNQTIDALHRIGKARRVILTGTPLQNELSEFWALCDFCARGELGPLHSFKSQIAAPIDAGRQPGASPSACAAAEVAKAKLQRLTERFVHRKDADVLSTVLLPRTEIAIFARLTEAQRTMYSAVAKAGGHPFATIRKLLRVCSHGDDGDDEVETSGLPPPSPPQPHLTADASKLALLMRLLEPLHASGERVVVCSTFRKSLDLIECAVRSNGWGCSRLDGTTPVTDANPSSTASIKAYPNRIAMASRRLSSSSRPERAAPALLSSALHASSFLTPIGTRRWMSKQWAASTDRANPNRAIYGACSRRAR